MRVRTGANGFVMGSVMLWTVFCVSAGGCSGSSDSQYPPRIVIKFVDGINVQLVSGKFEHFPSSEKDGQRNNRLTDQAIAAQLGKLHGLLQSRHVSHIAPLFSDGAVALRGTEGTAEPLDKAKTPDLALYYSIILKGTTPQSEIDQLIREIAALAIVQTAYLAPIGADPGMSVPQK